jgi:outer membrane protein assembly factor BamE (lipoprotein component of BamABCDE complex)
MTIWIVIRKLCALFCIFAFTLAGCGAAYQASTRIRTSRMEDSLKAGQTMPEVRQQWGTPEIITDQDPDTETWSYASRANTNDIAATLLYTAAKEGDSGEFLDLRFVNGKLVSWSKQEHTMPSKHVTLGIGFGTAPNTTGATHF